MKGHMSSWIRRAVIDKMSILPKAVCRFNPIMLKIPMSFFYRTRTKNSKVNIEPQTTPNSQSNLDKEQSWSYQGP